MAYGLNPLQTTNAAGTFNIESTGFIQGTTMDAPAIRNRLKGGVLATTETLAMYGGVAITESIPTGYVSGSSAGPKSLGPFIQRATAITGGSLPITGFCVFDQAHHMVATPASPVPTAQAGMSVNYYELGTGARIALQIDPGLITLQGGLITQQVSWDFTLQRIVAYTTGTALPIKILEIAPTNCMTVLLDGFGNGTWNRNGACAIAVI